MSHSRTILSKIKKALEKAGEVITSAVGTMWAAILFALLALVSLPAALSSGNILVIVSWLAQTFLQLVLLPIIMVGQNAHAKKAERRDNETHAAVMAAHLETQEILRQLHFGKKS